MCFCLNLTIITGMANLTNRWIPSYTVLLWAAQDIVAAYWVFTSQRKLRRRLGSATRRRYHKARLADEVRRSQRGLHSGSGAGVGVGAAAGAFAGVNAGADARAPRVKAGQVAPALAGGAGAGASHERRRSRSVETDDMAVMSVSHHQLPV